MCLFSRKLGVLTLDAHSYICTPSKSTGVDRTGLYLSAEVGFLKADSDLC